MGQCDVTETVRRVRGKDGGSDHADEQSCTGGCSIYSKSPAKVFVVRVLHDARVCVCVYCVLRVHVLPYYR